MKQKHLLLLEEEFVLYLPYHIFMYAPILLGKYKNPEYTDIFNGSVEEQIYASRIYTKRKPYKVESPTEDHVN